MYIEPDKIITEFLRHRLTDPRSRAEDTKTETFTASDGQTDFTLSPDSSFSCVTELKLNSTVQDKWQDYFVDLDNIKVIFRNGLNDGDSVEVTYKQGDKNWIYWGFPYPKISSSNFPRISVFIADSPTPTRLGQYNAPVESGVHFQIDCWAQEKQDNHKFDIDGVTYYGNALSKKLCYDVQKAMEDHIEDLYPALYENEYISGPRPMGFDDTYQKFRHMLELQMRTVKVGRIGE